MAGLAIALLLPVSAVVAKAPDKRWYFGGGVSYLSTIDYIRSNAAIIHTESFGDDGTPFTGDPNELTTCRPNPGNFFPAQNPFCDPRPDDLLARESVVEDSFKFDLTVGYQLTARFGVQLDAGYFQGEVGPIDIFQGETVPVLTSDGLPSRLEDRRISKPLSAGDLTEIPLFLSGIVRFRNEKAFRLYLGAGVGFIHTRIDVNEGDEMTEVIRLINASRVRGFGNEFGHELTDPVFNDTLQKEDGGIPFTLPLSVKVDDAFEWHLRGGVEYFLSDRLSLVFDAGYVFADQEVVIDFGGEDQLDIIYWPSRLYRPDGSLEVYIGEASAPNPVCFDPSKGGVNEFRFGCYNGSKNTRLNPEGQYRNIFDPTEILTGDPCPAFGDFNRDGQLDVCYPSRLRSPSGHPVTGIWTVQGGSIDLTAFSVAVGFRIHL